MINKMVIGFLIFNFFALLSCASLDSSNLKGDMNCKVRHHIGNKYQSIELGDTIQNGGMSYIPINCIGDIKLLDFYSSGKLLSETYYSGEKIEDEINTADPTTFEMTKQTIHYFKRIPTGTWTYYNRDGSVWKTVVFDDRIFEK